MPIKRPMLRRCIERAHCMLSILLLPLIALLPASARMKLMPVMASFFWPLVRSMLIPATQRDPHNGKPLQLAGPDLNSEHATILFGGNDCLRNEVAPLVEGISFFDGTVFHTKERPLLLMPLVEAPTEKEYIDKLFTTVISFLNQFPNIKKVYIIGHSLGAAITIQLTAQMRRKGPAGLKYFLALDRSFSSLAEVAYYLYPLTGWVMSRTLGLNWHFESAKTLKELAADENVFCHIYQISPDHVIGRAELLTKLRAIFPARAWPERWSYRTLNWPPNNYAHIFPFEEAFSIAASKKSSSNCQAPEQEASESER